MQWLERIWLERYNYIPLRARFKAGDKMAFSGQYRDLVCIVVRGGWLVTGSNSYSPAITFINSEVNKKEGRTIRKFCF